MLLFTLHALSKSQICNCHNNMRGLSLLVPSVLKRQTFFLVFLHYVFLLVGNVKVACDFFRTAFN
jgi:hypothetical protein